MKRKITQKIKEPVRIRSREIANGNTSIYFDIYKEGKRSYHYPKLYLIPELSIVEKERNAETLQIAKTMQAKLIYELQTGNAGVVSKKETKKANFIHYVEKMIEARYEMRNLIKHLINYAGKNIIFSDIDKRFVIGFIEHLKAYRTPFINKKQLNRNTINKIFNLLKTALNKAVRDEIIETNPCTKISVSERPKKQETKIEFLTIDEIKKLIQTDCKKTDLKHAFIFCCLTGLRFSDVKRLKFSDIKIDVDGKKMIEFRQKKTSGLMSLKLSEEALKWMPDCRNKEDNIFRLETHNNTNLQLKKWCVEAGITKKITFHCSRHTAATLNLTLGTPIEVVSKLLGHSKISTTQIYAKVVNEAQRAAVDKQDGVFD